ncbi:branched-chain amino acid ABC transporter substrate-binding protein [Deinococcus cellulosilyticus]|uniref:Branched chain amino acid ABC transporter substrate-binding protein n=1 Tax=Deinococcus cellulosilyticus (strain DSM 18568 / NBRC 106333 / KACC 11606 / 5516J-15) TaxID=1223518 RepID=A0A511N128_DEIC1|nr:branched-chain amino acid ABC transporter substrate-binding protein [Deinococcus cellulosilyticus]GEM46572.1 branched chain amino acid ABC transporter substrate-binding protein [Deinococcus cellulosilyticus NBRC 106333 = KACC 11606]
MLGMMLGLSALAQSLTPIKIAIVGNHQNNPIHNQVRLGALIALDEYKEKFKKEHKVDLQGLTLQDENNQRKLETALNDSSILGAILNVDSQLLEKVAPNLARDSLTLMTVTGTEDTLTEQKWPNINRIIARDELQSDVVARFAVNTFSPKRAMIINDKSRKGEAYAEELKAALEASNVRVVAYEGLPDNRGVNSVALKANFYQPDVIFYSGDPEIAGELLRTLKSQKIDVPFIGNDTLDSPIFTETAKSDAVGAYFASIAGTPDSFNNAYAFNKAYKEAYGKTATGWAIYGYDTTKVLLAGIEKALNTSKKVPTRAQVMQAVRNGTFSDLITGTLKFTPRGDRASTTLFIMRIGNDLNASVIRKAGGSQK